MGKVYGDSGKETLAVSGGWITRLTDPNWSRLVYSIETVSPKAIVSLWKADIGCWAALTTASCDVSP